MSQVYAPPVVSGGHVHTSRAHIPTYNRKSFQSHGSEFILLGYADDAKAYKLMELATKHCFIESNV